MPAVATLCPPSPRAHPCIHRVRYPKDMAVRNAPPALPPGEAHKLSKNYYYTRDARRAPLPHVRRGPHSVVPIVRDRASGSPTLARGGGS